MTGAAVLTAAETEAARTGARVARGTFAPWSAARVATLVASINRRWDQVDREWSGLDRGARGAGSPIARSVIYRPHNGVPRCITLDHPWYFERDSKGWQIHNAHTLQTVRVRLLAAA